MKRCHLKKSLLIVGVAFCISIIGISMNLFRREVTPPVNVAEPCVGTHKTFEAGRRYEELKGSTPFPKTYRSGQGQSIEVHDGLDHVNLVKGDRYSSEVNKACDEGALAAVTLKVVDEVGHAVADVDVRGGFWNNGAKGHGFSMKTDRNGLVQLRDTCYADMHCDLEKPGYYRTSLVYNFFQAGYDCVKDGRWIPFDPIVEVVIKRIAKPVAMYVSTWDCPYVFFPQAGVPIGYDLAIGDLVTPYGAGKTSDFDVTFVRDGTNQFWTSMELVLSTKDTYAGFYRKFCDLYSVFQSPYFANTNDVYQREIRFSFKHPNGKGRYLDGRLKENECIVLRTRTRIGGHGELVGAHYGKIYGPLNFSFSKRSVGEMKMLHYLNPNENDPNLEADPAQNLLAPKALGFRP